MFESARHAVAAAVGRPELIEDARYLTNVDRVAHADDLDEIIGAFIGERTLAENLSYFGDAGVTVGPIHDPSDLIEHEFIRGRGVVEDYPDEDYGQIPLHGVFPRLSETPGVVRAPAPTLGQHTEELLETLGRDVAERTRLREAGVV